MLRMGMGNKEYIFILIKGGIYSSSFREVMQTRKGVSIMEYQKPELVEFIANPCSENAMGPDGCSTAWSGCCYKE